MAITHAQFGIAAPRDKGGVPPQTSTGVGTRAHRCGTGWNACGAKRCCGPHDTCTDASGWGACCPNGTTSCGFAGLCCNAGEECTPGDPISAAMDPARCARLHCRGRCSHTSAGPEPIRRALPPGPFAGAAPRAASPAASRRAALPAKRASPRYSGAWAGAAQAETSRRASATR